MGLVPRMAEDGITPVYPEVIGCPVHTGSGWYDPELDWPWNDPSDPNYIPPWTGIEEEEMPSVEDLPFTEPIPQVPPTVPQEPAEPSAPGPDDWWSDFWEEENTEQNG